MIDYPDISLEDAGLHERVLRRLVPAGVVTLRQLAALPLGELANVGQVGPDAIAHMIGVLRKYQTKPEDTPLMPAVRTHVILPETVMTEIDGRAEPQTRGLGRSAAIEEGLSRYYLLLDRARRELRGRFSDAELSLIADACNGTIWQAQTLSMLPAQIEDSLEDDLAEKWGVDGPLLVRKLRDLSLTQTAAIVDAIERHWSAVARGEEPEIPGLLR